MRLEGAYARELRMLQLTLGNFSEPRVPCRRAASSLGSSDRLFLRCAALNIGSPAENCSGRVAPSLRVHTVLDDACAVNDRRTSLPWSGGLARRLFATAARG